MSGELAVHHILSNNATYYALLGGSAASARIYYEEAAQGAIYPHCVISAQGVNPNHTHDGDSDFDFDFVQVLHTADTKTIANNMAIAARNALAAATAGTYNTVAIDSIVFDDGDSFTERITDRKLYTVEQIYKVFVRQ